MAKYLIKAKKKMKSFCFAAIDGTQNQNQNNNNKNNCKLKLMLILQITRSN